MPSCQTHVQFHKCKTASAPLQHCSSCIKTLWTDEYPHPRITGLCPGPRASVSPSTHRPEKVKLCLRARKMDIILLSNAGEGSFHLTGCSQVQGWTLLQNHTHPGLILRSCSPVIPVLRAAHLDVSVWSNSLFSCQDTAPPWTEALFGITWLGLSLRVKVLVGVRPSVLQPSPSGAHRCTDRSTDHHCDLLAAKFPAKVLERQTISPEKVAVSFLY